MSKTLGRRCINVIQMLRVYWEVKSIMRKPKCITRDPDRLNIWQTYVFIATADRPNTNYTQDDDRGDEFSMTMLLKDDVITRAMDHTLHDQDTMLIQCRSNVVHVHVGPPLNQHCVSSGLFMDWCGLSFWKTQQTEIFNQCCYDGPASQTMGQH